MNDEKKEVNISRGDTGYDNSTTIIKTDVGIYRLIIVFAGILLGAIVVGAFIVLFFKSNPGPVPENIPNSLTSQKTSHAEGLVENSLPSKTALEVTPTMTYTDTPSHTSIPEPTLLPSHSKLEINFILASGHANPSQDSEGNPISYEPDKAIDGNISTAWRISGDGIAEWIYLDYGHNVELYEIGIIPGYAKIDPHDGTDRFSQNYVIKKIRLEFSTGASKIFTFSYNREMQYIDVEGIETTFIRIVILETYSPRAENYWSYTPISEIVTVGWEK